MSENRYWNLLAKKLSGEARPEELDELDELMREHPEWIYPAEHVQGLFRLPVSDKDSYDAELAFEVHLSRMKAAGSGLPQLEEPEPLPSSPSRKRSKGLLFFSGTALVIFMLAGWLWKTGSSAADIPATTKKFSE